MVKDETCQVGGCREKAFADASIPAYGGVWGYICKGHFVSLGCRLGLGKGRSE